MRGISSSEAGPLRSNKLSCIPGCQKTSEESFFWASKGIDPETELDEDEAVALLLQHGFSKKRIDDIIRRCDGLVRARQARVERYWAAGRRRHAKVRSTHSLQTGLRPHDASHRLEDDSSVGDEDDDIPKLVFIPASQKSKLTKPQQRAAYLKECQAAKRSVGESIHARPNLSAYPWVVKDSPPPSGPAACTSRVPPIETHDKTTNAPAVHLKAASYYQKSSLLQVRRQRPSTVA